MMRHLPVWEAGDNMRNSLRIGEGVRGMQSVDNDDKVVQEGKMKK